MNFRPMILRAALVAALLGVAYVVSIGVRRQDDSWLGESTAAPATLLLPLVGLPLVHLLIVR